MPNLTNEQEQNTMEDDEFFQNLFHREAEYISSTATSVYQLPPKFISFRYKILMWACDIVDRFLYNREVVSMTMDYIDRFMLLYPSPESIGSRTYQLIAMSSLYLAMKLQVEDNKGIVCLEKFSELSVGHLSPKDITSMEFSISTTLNDKLNPVSPTYFVDYFIRLMRPVEPSLVSSTTSQGTRRSHLNMVVGRKVLRELALHFIKLAISLPQNSPYFDLDCCQEQIVHSVLHRETFVPSTVAFVSILLSMKAISKSALPIPIREEFLRKCITLSTTAVDSNLTLNPERDDIKELYIRIKKRFRPEMFSKYFTTGETREDGADNPILIAIQQQGIFEHTFFEEYYSTDTAK